MTPPRIPALDAPYEPAVTDTFARFLPPGMEPLKLFRTQAHNPRVLQRMFAGNLLDAGTISVRVRELLILRTCARCRSEYEWGVHVALFAKQAGLSKEELTASLDAGDAPSTWPEPEAVLFALADELHDTATVSDQLWAVLARHYTPAQILELIAVVGNYHAVSFVANAMRVERETFAAAFN
jgi:alkylhydroperoxidase family enzyme